MVQHNPRSILKTNFSWKNIENILAFFILKRRWVYLNLSNLSWLQPS